MPDNFGHCGSADKPGAKLASAVIRRAIGDLHSREAVTKKSAVLFLAGGTGMLDFWLSFLDFEDASGTKTTLSSMAEGTD